MARAGAFALAAALVPAACASVPREPWVLASDELRGRPLRDPQRISTYPEALATALDVIQSDLGLPALEVQLLFLPDTQRFEAVLLRVGYPPRLARDAARQMIAIGGHRTVLINQRRLEREHRGWPERVSFLAHELAHVLQYAVGGGERGTSAQWLREGFAEWLAVRVMEALGREDSATAHSRAIARVRTRSRTGVLSFGGPDSFSRFLERTDRPIAVPSLAALGSWPDWVEQSRGEAGLILADYAFVAAGALVERHGAPAVVRYFALFAERQDPAAHFLEAFGEPEDEFEERLRRIVWP